MDDLWNKLQQIKKDLDAVEIEIAMNAEAIESVEMQLRMMLVELDHHSGGSSSAG